MQSRQLLIKAGWYKKTLADTIKTIPKEPKMKLI
jgi:hypothetical protein